MKIKITEPMGGPGFSWVPCDIVEMSDEAGERMQAAGHEKAADDAEVTHTYNPKPPQAKAPAQKRRGHGSAKKETAEGARGAETR